MKHELEIPFELVMRFRFLIPWTSEFFERHFRACSLFIHHEEKVGIPSEISLRSQVSFPRSRDKQKSGEPSTISCLTRFQITFVIITKATGSLSLRVRNRILTFPGRQAEQTTENSSN